jgi:hypothetical protein
VERKAKNRHYLNVTNEFTNGWRQGGDSSRGLEGGGKMVSALSITRTTFSEFNIYRFIDKVE